jgi:translation initiation factor 4E
MLHPLQTPWTFYYLQRHAGNTQEVPYEDSIHKIGKFSTCEDFWRFYSHMTRPDRLTPAISLHLFRNDSRAMWEDPENRDGGSFLLKFQKSQISAVWERLVLHLIGEQLPTDVVGAVVSPRAKVDLVYIWHQHARNEAIRLEICARLAWALELPSRTKMDYVSFDEMMAPAAAKNSVQYWVEADGRVMKAGPKE